MVASIYSKSSFGRASTHHWPELDNNSNMNIEPTYLRSTVAKLPYLSELDVVRHFTEMSQQYCIDRNFYPLGSCTMKYNPRDVHHIASMEGFLKRHPLAAIEHSQGYLHCAYELQEYLKSITGMQAVSLTPMAGAQGELTGMLMIRAYHLAKKDLQRNIVLVPDSAHGTNPATAVMCGYKVQEISTMDNGDIDLENLKQHLNENVAAIMLTNPSTLGLFERKIIEIQKLVHNAGALLYYDGANLNAILGIVRPGDMGFDVMHMNLHKTFATPHGGGGPGSGPVAANARLQKFLPVPMVAKNNNSYRWLTQKDMPDSIGRLSTFMGNAGILLRAYLYIRLLGDAGLKKVAEYATLNAAYLKQGLADAGLQLAYPDRLSTHEFVVTLKSQLAKFGLNAMDFAKRLLDKGFHAPTTYFPLTVPECWLIEPTETESKETLDKFIQAIQEILKEAETNAEIVKTAPHNLSVKRLDEVAAAKKLQVKECDL